MPDTSTAAASFTSFSKKSASSDSYTHCSSPSRFLRITKAIGPISRMVWTAPFTVTRAPSISGSRRSVSSLVSFCRTPVKNFIVWSPFAWLVFRFRLRGGRNIHSGRNINPGQNNGTVQIQILSENVKKSRNTVKLHSGTDSIQIRGTTRIDKTALPTKCFIASSTLTLNACYTDYPTFQRNFR